MRIGLVVPHIFMHRDILPGVIFSPGMLAQGLADGLVQKGVEVTLLSCGPVNTQAKNINADLSLFDSELKLRGDTYLDLLKKHPLTFITLSRQAQAEIIARAFAMANNNQLDLVHVYTNEEDIALPFASLCKKPVVFTHHDPFNFLVRYKNTFPKYKHLNWVSISYAQRAGMPKDTNWIGNIYHGIDQNRYKPAAKATNDYVAYLGRIIEPKGVHLAIKAIKKYNAKNPTKTLRLKIAGKHYTGHGKDQYWQQKIVPHLDEVIEYVGHIRSDQQRQAFLGNAHALIVPSIFDEPFGMVVIEALACGTPIIGLDSGAISELVKNSKTGYVVPRSEDPEETTNLLASALGQIDKINRQACRQDFKSRFTLDRMVQEHLDLYSELIQ